MGTTTREYLETDLHLQYGVFLYQHDQRYHSRLCWYLPLCQNPSHSDDPCDFMRYRTQGQKALDRFLLANRLPCLSLAVQAGIIGSLDPAEGTVEGFEFGSWELGANSGYGETMTLKNIHSFIVDEEGTCSFKTQAHSVDPAHAGRFSVLGGLSKRGKERTRSSLSRSRIGKRTARSLQSMSRSGSHGCWATVVGCGRHVSR
jgi:hypothetical protein